MTSNLLFLMGFFKGAPRLGKQVYSPEDNDNYHVSLLPGHTIAGKNLPSYMKELERVLTQSGSLVFETDHTDMYGPSHDIPVMVLKRTDKVLDLHMKLVALVLQFEGKFVNPEYVGDEFHPHVSYLTDNCRLQLTTLSLFNHEGGLGVEVSNLRNFELGS